MISFQQAEELVAIHGTPSLLLSRRSLIEAYRTLKSALPGVELYYAVKSNSLSQVVEVLRDEGALFDVCTNGEIDVVRNAGITAPQCMHTHPIKRDSDIRFALEYGIRLFVADNEFELTKFLPYRDKCELLVRMSIQNPSCLVNLSHKFGAAPADTFALVEKAVAMGLKVKGVCFHVGSQNETTLKYIEALEYCRDIYRRAALAGFPMEIIDIGGGFPIDYLSNVTPIRQICQPITEYLERYFGNYRIIAEPGRFLSGGSMALATRIIGKSLRDGVWWYYLDEGLYGSFSGKMYDHADYPLFMQRSGDKHNSILAGPTCDSIDVLYENISLPFMEIGDLLLFGSMGAYTYASASTFNGFPKANIVVID